MKRNKRIFDMSKSELSKGIFTLGFGAAIGFAACIYMLFTYAIIIVAIILLVIIIKQLITYFKHKKIAPTLEKIDNCSSDKAFTDLMCELMTFAFKNGFILKSDYFQGEKNVDYCFIKSDKLITYDEISKALSSSDAYYKAVVTNSHLSRNALTYCKNRRIIIVDRDVIIDILLFNLKFK